MQSRAWKFLDGSLRDVRGATAIEYAMIAAGIAMVVVSVVYSLGDAVNAQYESVQAELE